MKALTLLILLLVGCATAEAERTMNLPPCQLGESGYWVPMPLQKKNITEVALILSTHRDSSITESYICWVLPEAFVQVVPFPRPL